MKLRSLATSVFMALLLASPAVANAQTTVGNEEGITMTPSSSEPAIDRGKSRTGKVQLINGSSAAFNIEVTSSPYNVLGLAYEPSFKQLPGTTDASKWVKFTSPTTQTLTSKGSLTFNYSLNVPANTAPGGYYAVIFASAKPSEKPAKGVKTTKRLGSILYITVNGPVRTTGNVKAAPLPTVSFGGTVQPGVVVENTGGTHFKSQVSMQVNGLLGGKVFEAQQERIVLPQTSRQITDKWELMSPIGIYKVSLAATVAGEEKRLSDKWLVTIQPWLLIIQLIFIITVTSLYLANRKIHRKHTK